MEYITENHSVFDRPCCEYWNTLANEKARKRKMGQTGLDCGTHWPRLQLLLWFPADEHHKLDPEQCAARLELVLVDMLRLLIVLRASSDI
uniref:Uncharacterized protein n=1 Tax=Ditylenchus dipsaci TaxID=166011 RepID=A0A915ECI5_9BILA